MNQWQYFYRLRKRIFDLIRKVDNGYHKSYEGAVDIIFHFNNIYESKDVEDIDSVEIELHCYLLVNGRHIKWEGETFLAALNKMNDWITEMEIRYLISEEN